MDYRWKVGNGKKTSDEILTYKYVKPRVQWFPNEEDPLTYPFRITRGLRGYAHRARSRAPSGKDFRLSLTRPQHPPGARGLPRVLGSRSTAPPGLTLGSCPANDASQGPGTRRQAPGYRCPGASWRRSLGVPLPTAPPTWSSPGRDTRRQSFPRPPGLGGFRARTSAPGADLLHHQKDSRRSI